MSKSKSIAGVVGMFWADHGVKEITKKEALKSGTYVLESEVPKPVPGYDLRDPQDRQELEELTGHKGIYK